MRPSMARSEDSDEALDLLTMLAEDVHMNQSTVYEIPEKTLSYDEKLDYGWEGRMAGCVPLLLSGTS